MRKHRKDIKIDKVLRVWIAAISAFAAASELQASSSLTDSLPELDRRTLLRGIRKPRSRGKLPSKYVANSERVENQESVQHEFNYAGEPVDLTWDDNSADSMCYGQDDATVSEEKQDALVLKALSYYPEQHGDTHHLSEMIAATCEEADALSATGIPVSGVESISDEELELNYREFEAMQDLEDQAEHADIQDTAASIGQGVMQVSNLEIDNTQFVTSADEHEQSSMTKFTGANDTRSEENIELASHAISHNIDALSSNIWKRFEVTGMVAIAAGDDDTEGSGARVNTYINPIIGKASQKETGGISGYHANSRGITIGFDSYAQDNILLGMSYTKADNHMKFSNNKLGDRSKVTSDFYTLYGQLEPYNKNISISGIGIYGISNIKSSARRSLDSIAISSHKAYSNIAQVTVGTQYKLSKHIKIMPQLGIKYSKIRDAAYAEIVSAEAADARYGLSVAGTKERIIETMAGFKVNYDHQLSQRVSIAPMIYGFIYKNVAAKMPVIKSWMQRSTNNEVLSDVSISRSRLNFRYGTGLSVQVKNIEMGIFYNGSKARRYISHAGSLKLKINI